MGVIARTESIPGEGWQTLTMCAMFTVPPSIASASARFGHRILYSSRNIAGGKSLL